MKRQRWKPARALRAAEAPPALRGWLRDTGSLTAHLKALCGAGFAVRVLRQGLARPRVDEARALGAAPARLCLLREVELLCAGTPVVRARSLIPLATLSGGERRLARLGSRPLGGYLFSRPDLWRGPLSVGRAPGGIHGRRGLFRLRGKSLLVAEHFLPALARFGQREGR